MPEFIYQVKTPGGEIVKGSLEASEERVAVDRLRSRRYVVLDIREVRRTGLEETFQRINPFRGRVKAKDLVVFSRQLATLVSAGIPIVQGLSILLEQLASPYFRKIVVSVREDIEGGVSISEAVSRHPEAFSELYVSMIHAGEVGGILDVILERLANYLEAAQRLRRKVRGALVYPAVVITVATGVTIFLLTTVIPTFKLIFEGFGAELPLPTQLLISFSEFVRANILFILGAPILFAVAFRFWYKTETGKLIVDRQLLKLPVFGPLFRKVAIAKFTRTLSTLVKSGVPILHALDTVAKVSGNKIVERAILEARESIREGERIAQPLKESGVFPPMVIQMISVGEETGNLDTMLGKVADFYDEEVDVAVAALTSMIEPFVIVFLGIIIGSIVIAMFMPMFELGGLAAGAG